MINPPLVAQNGSGCHLIAGERRWRATCANALLDSGLFPTLEAAVERVAANDGPAYIAGQPALAGLTMTARLALGATPEQLHVAAVVENGEREDLNPIEEALDFQNLMDAYGWSSQRTAKEVQKSEPYVRGRVIWLQLEPEIRQLVAARHLSKDRRVAEALLSVPDPATRRQLAHRFAQRKTKIAAIEVACAKVAAAATAPPKQPEPKKTAVNPATVPIHQAVIVQKNPPKLAAIQPSTLCLCADCREVIANLAEELCGPCSARGLTAKCLTCPGVVEFINKLTGLAQC